jgi:dynein regulatory complex protein 1
LDDIVEVLEEFHANREKKLNEQDVLANPSLKKKSNFQTEEQKEERRKREEKQFWERMTNVLSDKGYALWRALDKALTKYYALIVERQNLIEETGLLYQQNEELKTLLNQYL